MLVGILGDNVGTSRFDTDDEANDQYCGAPSANSVTAGLIGAMWSHISATQKLAHCKSKVVVHPESNYALCVVQGACTLR